MSENFDEEVTVTQDELTALKARADLLGLAYHPSIGLSKLRIKVLQALEPDDEPEVVKTVAVETKESDAEFRNRLRREAAQLVRIRVACMNPDKKDWAGEIIYTGNSYVGSFAKYIPFNAEEGWHVPQIILTQLQERKCQIFVTSKDSKGNSTRRGKLIKEFGIEILPPLSSAELKDLAQRQALANAID